MSKLIKDEKTRRIEIEWDIWASGKTPGHLQLRRRCSFIPITKDGKVQWRRRETFDNEPITVAADELTTIMATLLEWVDVIPEEKWG